MININEDRVTNDSTLTLLFIRTKINDGNSGKYGKKIKKRKEKDYKEV